MSEMTLRERKKVATREAIVAAARRLFAERGYEATTIDDITEAAVVSRRTFFRYFATKEDLVFADEDDMLHIVGTGIATGPESATALDLARHAALALADTLETRRSEVLAQHQVVSTATTLQPRAHAKHLRWQDTLVDRLTGRGVDPDLAALTARLMIVCFDLALERWYVDGGQSLRVHLDRTFADARRVVCG